MRFQVPVPTPGPTVDLPDWLEWGRALGLTFGPFLTFGIALIAAVIAFKNYRQRKVADARAEWWRRAEWALEAASDAEDDERPRIGIRALYLLVDSELASEEDRTLVDQVMAEVIEARKRRASKANGADETMGAHAHQRTGWSWFRRRCGRQ